MTVSAPAPSLPVERPAAPSYWAVVGGQLRRNPTTMAAWRLVCTLLGVAVAAPVLASNVPLAYSDGKGLSLPLAGSLFDRFLFASGVDVFFNLLLVAMPLWWIASALTRPPRAPRPLAERLLGASRWARWTVAAGVGVLGLGALGVPYAKGVGWTALAVSLPWGGPASVAIGGAASLLWGVPLFGWLLLALALPWVSVPVFLAWQVAGAFLEGGGAAWMLGIVAVPGAAAIVLSRASTLRARRVVRFAVLPLLVLVGFLLLLHPLRSTRPVVPWPERVAAVEGPAPGFAVLPPCPFHPDNIGEAGTESLGRAYRRPGGANPLGCDPNGRDVLARLVFGTRISMTIGLIAVAIYIAIGNFLGGLAGYYGGWTDLLISRLVEIMICFPTLFLLLTIIAVFDTRSIFLIMAAIGLVGWPGVSRLVRGEFLRQRGLDYVVAAKAQGIRERRIIFRHVLPNCLGPVLVSATFGIAAAILTESSLAFLGLGDTNVASWGQMLSSGRDSMLWHLILAPGFAIFFVVTIFNLVGEGLRDALDPKLRR